MSLRGPRRRLPLASLSGHLIDDFNELKSSNELQVIRRVLLQSHMKTGLGKRGDLAVISAPHQPQYNYILKYTVHLPHYTKYRRPRNHFSQPCMKTCRRVCEDAGKKADFAVLAFKCNISQTKMRASMQLHTSVEICPDIQPFKFELSP